MNKLMMVAGMVALAAALTGCATGGAADADKVAAWQKERTPVEALDVAPYGIYKAIADKVDKAAVVERYRRIYLGYVADVKALEQQGKSRDAARKEVLDQVKAQPNGAETIAKLNEYLKISKETDFEAIMAWIQKITEELQAASQKFAEQTPQALQQLVDIAKKEGGMAVMKIPSQGKDDLAVIGAQLKDAGVGLALYVEMVNADKEAAKVQVDYPVEG